MHPLYLIPARGGSKGVPGKNIRPLGGLPLISHSIATALEVVPEAADVVVSTDSEEIADIARRSGATVPFLRPAELASDTAGSREVMLHAVDFMNREGERYDTVVLLQPTSPFRNPQDIVKAIDIFRQKSPDMVVSVKPASSNPYYNAYECDETGCLKISKGEGKFTRRQDAPEVWEFDGSIYVIDVESLRRYPSLGAMKQIIPLPNTEKYNIDIDTELDFLIAEKLYESRNSMSK